MTSTYDVSPTQHRPEDPLLTIDGAAEYLAVTKATLYTWRSRRIGYSPRAVKVGGCLRYRRSELDAWITAHTEDRTSEDDQIDPYSGEAGNPGTGVDMRPSGRS